MTTPTQLAQTLEQLSGDPVEASAVAIRICKEARDYEKASVAPWREVQRLAKGVISDIMLELGVDNVNTQAGKAYVPKPGVSVKYDARALDALCESSAELQKILWPHRQETMRAGSLTIR